MIMLVSRREITAYGLFDYTVQYNTAGWSDSSPPRRHLNVSLGWLCCFTFQGLTVVRTCSVPDAWEHDEAFP